MHIIFHIPKHIDRTDASASEIRPSRLIRTFKELGYVVDVVEGYGRERKAQIAAIKKKIRDGVKYDFLYSESSTMPTLLTERHHLPTYPCLDFSFLRFCKKNAIPIGLFYRDIHWCFVNRDKGIKQRIAKCFYLYDLRMYSRLLDVLFLPSLEMLPHIPYTFSQRVLALPAGCDMHPAYHHPFDGTLRLLYIGGIGGNYDLRLLLQAVGVVPSVSLTLCCRPDDWSRVQQQYAPFLNDRIQIVHQQGEKLVELYARHDLFAMFFISDYIQFAVPFKLFDTIGYQMPILAPSESWTGQYVTRNAIGVACDNTLEALQQTLLSIVARPNQLDLYCSHLAQVVTDNTWTARCNQIASALL